MQNTIFTEQSKIKSNDKKPLAELLRPQKFEDFAGQQDLVGENGILKKLVLLDQLPSMILWGPPGVGKTSLAKIIANETNARFVKISAVSAGKKDMQEVVRIAKEAAQLFDDKKTILFIDEIHRFNKAQQDYLLPFVEDGTITLIGATTENPSFEIIGALLSRCRVFVLNRHDDSSLRDILKRTKLHLSSFNIKLKYTAKASKLLFLKSNGDPRTMLNMIEIAVKLYAKAGIVEFTVTNIEAISKSTRVLYDKSGEEHYNIISALIKSMRASDTNAALYWLARLVESGEDLEFIARRCCIFASEDIGNSEPMALILANSAFEAVRKVGWPESRIILSQIVIFLANAKKDNSAYIGIEKALADAKDTLNLPVPLHLRNAPTELMKNLGYSKGYIYDHNLAGKKSGQQCLPDSLKDHKYI